MSNDSRSASPALLDALSAYEVDAQTGFVAATDPLDRLPTPYAAWEDCASSLPGLIRSRRIRAALKELPLLDALELRSAAERERALLILTVFANAWVWGDEQPDLQIPARIAIPLCALAQALDRPPLLHYASMTLHNWRRIDRREPLSADNACMQIQILGGVDEDWFFIASLGVELAGAPLLALVHAGTATARLEDDHALTVFLEQIAEGMTPVLQALARMREWCDPHVFYHRVRPYLRGWPDPGVLYEGVSAQRKKYVGGSAGQSSLIQVLDALLGIDHSGTPAGSYLREVRACMPIAHRRFIEDVERVSMVRARALSGSEKLRAAYNAAVAQLDRFRGQHMALAYDYILRPSGTQSGGIGTGGTSFVDFLSELRADTTRSQM